MRSRLSDNGKWSEVFVREFCGGSVRTEIFGLHVHLVANLEIRSWTSFCVSRALIAFLSFSHLRSEEFVELVQVGDKGLRCGGGEVAIGIDGEVRMVALVGEERRYSSGSTRSVVVREFGEREEFCPVVLLIVAVNPEVLLERLISAFCLTIALGMIPGGEMEAHIESFT